MLVQTILNSLTHYKSFVFDKVHLHKTETEVSCIDIEIIPRKNSRPICPKCGKKCSIYDTERKHRRFEFVPLWNIPVFFIYTMRRVHRTDHGVLTEQVPWSDGKYEQTVEYRQFLANWAKRMSWSEVAECFHTTFGKVYRSVAWLVQWGLEHRELLLNWFHSRGLSSGVVEGFNNKVKLTARKSYGFKSFVVLRIALFHALGNLPQPEYAHRFW